MHAPSTRHRAPRRTADIDALAFMDSLFDSAAIGLGYMDRDMHYLRINHLLATINGRSVEQHIGRTFRDVIPQIADRLEEIHRQVIATGEPARDLEIRTNSPAWPGEVRDYLASYLPVRGRDGAVLGVLSMVHDVTETRRAE